MLHSISSGSVTELFIKQCHKQIFFAKASRHWFWRRVNILRLLTLFAVSFLITSQASAFEGAPIEISEIESGGEVSQHFWFAEDPEKSATFEEILSPEWLARFEHMDHARQFSRARSAYWFRVDLVNNSPNLVERLLVVGYPNLQKITFHEIDNKTGQIRTQNRSASDLINEVDVRFRLPVYSLSLAPNDAKTVLLRIESPTIRTGMNLWKAQDLIQSGQISEWWFVAFVGVVLAASLYMLVIAVVSRSRLYLSLFAVAVMFVLVQFTMHGHAYMLFGGFGGVFNLSWLLLQAWTASAILGFSYLFLGAEKLPFLVRAFILSLIGIFLILGVVSIIDYISAMHFVQPLIIGGVPILIAATIHQAFKKNKDALLFLLCFVPIFILAVLVNLSGAGIIGSPELGTIIAAAWVPTTIIFFLFLVLFRARTEQRESEEKSKFLAILSHEVRTPLTGILGTVELLRSTPLNTRQKRFVENLSHSGKALLTLLNDVLELSKVRSDKLSLRKSEVDPTQLVESMASLMSARAEEKGVTVRFQKEGDIPASVIADETRLRQVLLNLVGNAVKFTEQGDVFVRLIASSSHDGISKLRFEIEDEGPGIPDDIQEDLFQPFVQADDDSTRAFEGTGLGLAICKELVELMGSKILLSSEVGKGSCFSFEISAEIAQVEHEEHVTDTQKKLPDGAGRSLLVVDDTAMNREVIGDLLRGLGYRVDVVASGGEAIEYLASSHVDAVIMDVFMPDMNGPEVVRTLREAKMQVPVLGLTAALDKHLIKESLTSGMSKVLHKPVEVDQIAHAIADLLNDGAPARPDVLNYRILDSYAASLGDEQMREHIKRFTVGIRELFLELEDSISGGDPDDQERLAHRLAGSATMFGLEAFGSKAESLSSSLRAGDILAIDRDHFDGLGALLKSSLQELETFALGLS